MERAATHPAPRRRQLSLSIVLGAALLASLPFAARVAARLSAAGGGAAAARPELFVPGVLSTPDDESGISFSPDGRTAYFCLRSATTTSPPVSAICVSERRAGRWSEPEVAPFSGLWHDSSPAVSPDGRELFFVSDRPVPGLSAPRDGAGPPRTHIWVMERTASGWGPPRSLAAPVLSADGQEDSPAPAADGTLYFASDRPGGKGGFDLYRAERRQRAYGAAVNLAAVNSRAWELGAAIAPDQSLLVFAAAGRPDALSGGGERYVRADLYVSRRDGDGGWTAPRSLGPSINSPAEEQGPSLSPDGRWLYFSSERNFISVPMARRLTARDFAAGLGGLANGMGNLYRVPISAVRQIASGPAAAPPGGAP